MASKPFGVLSQKKTNPLVRVSACLFYIKVLLPEKGPAFVILSTMWLLGYCYFLFLFCKHHCLGVLRPDYDLFCGFGAQANTHVNVPQELKDVKLWQVLLQNPVPSYAFLSCTQFPFSLSLILDSFMCSTDAIHFILLIFC